MDTSTLEVVICDCCDTKHVREKTTAKALCGWLVKTVAHTVPGQPYSDALVTCCECQRSVRNQPR
jgi:hypothetical protein